MGNALCATDDDAAVCCWQTTVHECYFPLWAVKVADFLNMTGPPEPHNVLMERGLLHEWFPGMFVVFVSHQWLSSSHPDPDGCQVKVLQQVLRGMIDDSLQVQEDIVSMSVEKRLLPNTREHIADGYLFFDWFAIPQITARSHGINEETTKSDAAKAVQSIPAYVELSNLFLALVPELTHKNSLKLVNYCTWLSRGWCRAELWCRLLSTTADPNVIVVYSAREAEFIFPLDWQQNSIVEGDFTVESDRAAVAKLGEIAVESKIRHLRAFGPLVHYRFYMAQRPRLMGQKRSAKSVETFLKEFHFNSLEDAVSDKSSMNAVMCAVLSGDEGMLRLLAANNADMNHSLMGLGDLGFYDTQTALMAAAKSNQDPSLLSTMLELRAEVNAEARTGISALFVARSPGVVQVLLEAKADMRRHFSLNGIASFASPETIQAILDARCDPEDIGDAKYGPLHALTLYSRGNRHALESAKLLLSARADVNARSSPSGRFLWECRFCAAKLAVLGFEASSMLTRVRASMPGITPLGYAALVGHKELTKLYLAHGAEILPNVRGDLPEDLARANHHCHLMPLLSTFAT
mmetsp:Transcript_70773/g.166057  ORF Transcript_70773/g.166057 Transcript_70773/m.166057 type:complete len:577 (+) Transcript_70773:42-1772(+)